MNLEEALQLLKDKGFKYTGKREQMLTIFDREKRYLAAKELLELMQEDYPDLSFDTIYRNLTLFEELEIVEATDLSGERKFRIRCSPSDHHHHLICLSCGKTKPIRSCPMDAMLGEPPHFRITGHKFEIYGYCSDCETHQTPS